MITISKIIDHASLALGRLVSQFANSPKLTGMITAISNECQAIEDALWDVLTDFRDPTVATGTTLDNIGDLIGAPVRGPKNDTQYRNRIAGQVVINRSSGESGSIYGIAKGLVDAWNVANQPRARETGPAQFTIGCHAVSFHVGMPTGLAFGVQSTTGGHLVHGVTVAYRVSAVTAAGETLAASEIVRTLSGATSTNTQHIQWNAVAGASSYKVYGRTSGAELFMGTVAATQYPGLLGFIDDGTVGPSGALPVIDSGTFSNDTSLTNDMAEARELANVLVNASSAGVRAIVRSRSSAVGAGGFFRFKGGTGSPAGFGVGSFIGAYDR